MMKIDPMPAKARPNTITAAVDAESLWDFEDAQRYGKVEFQRSDPEDRDELRVAIVFSGEHEQRATAYVSLADVEVALAALREGDEMFGSAR